MRILLSIQERTCKTSPPFLVFPRKFFIPSAQFQAHATNLRELPHQAACREEAKLPHRQNLEVAHRLVPRLEGLPEVPCREAVNR